MLIPRTIPKKIKIVVGLILLLEELVLEEIDFERAVLVLHREWLFTVILELGLSRVRGRGVYLFYIVYYSVNWETMLAEWSLEPSDFYSFA